MDKATWLACTNPQQLLGFIMPRASERKLILFGSLCCRRAAQLLTDPRHQQLVEATESFADGRISEADFAAVMEPITAMWGNRPSHQEHRWGTAEYMTAATRHLGSGTAAPYAASFAASALACLAGPDESAEWCAALNAERVIQSDMLRDLVGDPSPPFSFEPTWLVGEGRVVAAQARSIYEAGRFDLVSQLADALERAGCQDRSVLEHCRQPGSHVRGCWVVDALLGKAPAVTPGLLTSADWQRCANPFPLLCYLRDKGSARKWRLFDVACCLRIDRLITDKRSRAAVAVAARYADDQATDEELANARLAAQAAQDEAWHTEYAAEAEANFCYTPAYAATCCRLAACSAARSAVCQNPRQTDAEPGSRQAEWWRPSDAHAACAVASNHFTECAASAAESEYRAALASADAAQASERESHCHIMRDIFGQYFGPPRAEGIWLRVGPSSGGPRQPLEQWGHLPTSRQVRLEPAWLRWNDGLVVNLARVIYDDKAFDRLPILADALEDAGCNNSDILNHCRQPGEHVRGCWVMDLVLEKK